MQDVGIVVPPDILQNNQDSDLPPTVLSGQVLGSDLTVSTEEGVQQDSFLVKVVSITSDNPLINFFIEDRLVTSALKVVPVESFESIVSVVPSPGKTGPTGPVGIIGPTGPVGGIGPTGPSDGPTGPAGLSGATGPEGELGPTGAAGLLGPTGARGSTGPIGAVGSTGPQGVFSSTGFLINQAAILIANQTLWVNLRAETV